ncbi:MAG: ribosome recycling factor [Butyricicoccus sp.]
MKEQIKSHEAKMQKTLDVLSKELAAVRAGRANPAVLDKITVEYYGAPTPLNQVAAISTPDPRTLAIQPWDGSVLKAIEKAIQVSDLGINPQNDGKQIRLNFPPLTEERRKELIKGVSKTGEEAKVALRNIRRDALESQGAQKKSEITEDELHDGEDKMQKLTDKYVKEVDAMVAKKSKELAEV